MGVPVGGPAESRTAFNFRTVPNNSNAKWWLDKGLRRNVFHCVGLCGTLFFNGYDGSLFNGLQVIDAWQTFFHHPSSNTLGVMNSSALIPGIITPWFAERIASRWGRRWPVWIGCLVNMAGAIVNAASKNLGMYIAGRVLMGIGISLAVTIGPTLLHEVAHPRFRAPVGSVYTTIYYIAAVISASVVLGTRTIQGNNIAWRIPCYLQLLGPVATLAITISMPESPRWLVAHDKPEGARKVLADYHANGDIQDPLVELEYNEILLSLHEESAAGETRYVDFFAPNNRQRLLIIVLVGIGGNWVGNGIITYYLAPILNTVGVTKTSEQALLNLGLQIWNLIISTCAALNVDRIGRRPLWLTSTLGMMFSFIVVMTLSGIYATHGENHNIGIAVIPFLFIFFGFYDIAWTPLPNMYSVEVLPYSLRTKGQALYCIIQNAANAINAWINPIILDAIAWKYYGVYIGILAFFATMIYLTFPETKNLTMEEIAIIFDGDRAQGIRDVAAAAIRGKPHAMQTAATEADEAISVRSDHARDHEKSSA